MAQRVDRPVVAELFVEVDAEDRDVHREHAAGMVTDHQRSAGREGIQAVHLRPEVRLQDRPHHSHQALGQDRGRICRCPRYRAIAVGHVPPLTLRRGRIAASSPLMVASWAQGRCHGVSPFIVGEYGARRNRALLLRRPEQSSRKWGPMDVTGLSHERGARSGTVRRPNGSRDRHVRPPRGGAVRPESLCVDAGTAPSTLPVDRAADGASATAPDTADHRQADYFLRLLAQSRRLIDHRIDEYREGHRHLGSQRRRRCRRQLSAHGTHGRTGSADARRPDRPAAPAISPSGPGRSLRNFSADAARRPVAFPRKSESAPTAALLVAESPAGKSGRPKSAHPPCGADRFY